ncbi:hypothetical protein [Rhodococcus sp. NPDC060176]|uniref:hypothetical protein n=1 Tax=Rhodococcus sp. NPDC060176 TaxID=3347062 RepID=UPI0036466750
MDPNALSIRATTAQYPDACGATIDVTAIGHDNNPHDPPVWGKGGACRTRRVRSSEPTVRRRRAHRTRIPANRAVDVQFRSDRIPIVDHRGHRDLTHQLPMEFALAWRDTPLENIDHSAGLYAAPAITNRERDTTDRLPSAFGEGVTTA